MIDQVSHNLTSVFGLFSSIALIIVATTAIVLTTLLRKKYTLPSGLQYIRSNRRVLKISGYASLVTLILLVINFFVEILYLDSYDESYEKIINATHLSSNVLLIIVITLIIFKMVSALRTKDSDINR